MSKKIGAAAPAKTSAFAKLAMKPSELNIALIVGLTSYGDSTPLYGLVGVIGIVEPINGLADAFESHAEAAKALKNPGMAGYSVSEFDGRNAYSLALNTGKGIAYVGIMHDKDGEPVEEETVAVVRAKVMRDFSIIDEQGEKKLILKQNQIVFKAVNEEYYNKMEEVTEA